MTYFDPIVRQYPLMDEAWQAGLAALKPSESELQHGLALHRDAVALDNFGFLPTVWTDALVDKLDALVAEGVGGREYHMRATRLRRTAAAEDCDGPAGREFLAGLQASGLNGMNQTVGAATVAGMSWLEADLAAMSGFTYLCHRFRRRLFQAASAAELREAHASGRFGIIWSANSPPLPGRMVDPDDELQRIEVWYQLGFRLCHLSYNRRNFVAEGGVEDVEQDGGLSTFGREVVAEFNRVGLIVDVPHSSRRTVLDAANATTRPMMSSHAGCRALFDHHRNKTDEEMKAIASTDGLVGIVGLPRFLGDNADLNTMLDHVMHAVKVVGPRHVAIGTDGRAPTKPPAHFKPRPAGRFTGNKWSGGWREGHAASAPEPQRAASLAWTNWPLYTVGLVMRGVSDDDIRQILGLNLMRVLEANAPPQSLGGRSGSSEPMPSCQTHRQ